MIPALIVPVLTRPELLYRMLESIDYPVGDVLVIDNGHCVDPDLGHPLVERLHVLRMPSNLGVPVSWNLGIKATPFAAFWLIAGFDVTFPPGALARFARESNPGAVTLADCGPPWACFTIGDAVVRQVGLFDEGFVPAYHEDLDFSRRCHAAGVPVIQSDIHVDHDNSSTLRSDPRYDALNAVTFPANQAYYNAKVERGDLSEGHWSLSRRRDLSWD